MCTRKEEKTFIVTFSDTEFGKHPKNCLLCFLHILGIVANLHKALLEPVHLRKFWLIISDSIIDTPLEGVWDLFRDLVFQQTIEIGTPSIADLDMLNYGCSICYTDPNYFERYELTSIMASTALAVSALNVSYASCAFG